MTGEPPSSALTTQVTAAEVDDVVAEAPTPVGAPGVPTLSGSVVADVGPVPTALVAVTVNV